MPFHPLISAESLQNHLEEVVILDGSYYLPTMGKDPDVEFENGHIPGAQRWDIDQIADTTSSLKHMMPEPAVIAQAAGQRGIHRDTHVVVYDQLGMFSAARVWLALKTIGHEKVALLDGGLPCWNGVVDTGKSKSVTGIEYGDFDTNVCTVDRHTVLESLSDNGASVVDARAADRFQGSAPEPKPGLLGGHMPGALNIPFGVLLDSQSKFKSPDQLRQIFKDYKLDTDHRVITSCGSGVTASIITFALMLLGVESMVYDGSWSEWGDPSLQLPVKGSDET